MAKIGKGVFDSGPFIHLHEINQLKILGMIKEKYLSSEVENELKHYLVPLEKVKNVIIKILLLENKNLAKIICERYCLDLGEATSIALAKQEKINLFFTDDLEARETAKLFGLEAHGTLGIIMRALREKILTKETAIKSIEDISDNSSLFLTSDLVEWTVKEVKRFKV